MKTPHRGQDLIIGMTLAEVFLLALLVGWLGSRDEISVLEIGRQALEAQNGELKISLATALRERDEWQKKYDELLDSVGVIDPRTGELVRFGEKPKCDVQSNVLIDASVVNGQIAVVLARTLAEYRQGQMIPESQLSTFLRQIRQSSDSQNVLKGISGCRWQYRLLWATDTDYRMARETFEQVFYVGGIRRQFD